MPVIAHVLLRGVSTEQYDAVRAETGWLEQTPEGGLGHMTWWEGNDCHNLDAGRARTPSTSLAPIDSDRRWREPASMCSPRSPSTTRMKSSPHTSCA